MQSWTDEVEDNEEPRHPSKLEQVLAERSEFERILKKEAARKKAKRKKAKASRRLNRR